MNELRLNLSAKDFIAEYKTKKEKLEKELEFLTTAITRFEMETKVQGCYVGRLFDGSTVGISKKYMEDYLNKSAWQHMYNACKIEDIAPKTHKEEFKRLLQNPPEFNEENVFSVYGSYLADPRAKALQAFAEVFNNLDPFYKSHDNFGVGKKGLPKRVIISGCTKWGGYCGWAKVADVVNALMRYRGLTGYVVTEYNVSDAVYYGGEYLKNLIEMRALDKFAEVCQEKYKDTPYFGLTFKRFANGNCHVIFDKQAMDDINCALAEYYGEVLPDAYEHTDKKAESKEVSKDLQFYPTPLSVAKKMVQDIYFNQNSLKILEPSCGEGNILDVIRENANQDAIIHGVEFDAGRAIKCREKGYTVFNENFLTFDTEMRYDYIIMNPPFYGTHYIKHIEKAKELLAEDGRIIALLPATARYKHGLLKECKQWWDLPVGSFSESGTNVNTTICTIFK